MDKENVAHPYTPCILFHLENEGNSAMSDNVNKLGGLYAQGNKLDSEQLPHDLTYIRNLK